KRPNSADCLSALDVAGCSKVHCWESEGKIGSDRKRLIGLETRVGIQIPPLLGYRASRGCMIPELVLQSVQLHRRSPHDHMRDFKRAVSADFAIVDHLGQR